MKIVILAEKPIQAFAYAEAIATYQKRQYVFDKFQGKKVNY